MSPRALLALPLAVLLVGCTGTDDTPEVQTVSVEVGTVLRGSVVLAATGRDYSVLVPDGEVTLEVSNVTDRLSSSEFDGPGGQDAVAADGAAIVGIRWDAGQGFSGDEAAIMSGRDLAKATEPGEERVPAALTVVAGAERIDLPATQLGRIGDDGVVYVGVPADETIDVEVTYDGVTQRRDVTFEAAPTAVVTTGPAAPLYEIAKEQAGAGPSDTSASCPSEPDAAPIYCGAASVFSVPYVPGQGWAPEGSTWLVADAYSDTRDDGFESDGWSATVDGQEPVTALDLPSDQAGPDFQRLVWGLPTATSYELAVSATYTIPSDPGSTMARDATIAISPVPHD